MHAWAFQISILWLLILVAVLALYAVKAPNTVQRAMAVDTLALVFVAALAAVAIRRQEAGFLDIALVLAMLGFAQTVAVARIVKRRKDL